MKTISACVAEDVTEKGARDAGRCGRRESLDLLVDLGKSRARIPELLVKAVAVGLIVGGHRLLCVEGCDLRLKIGDALFQRLLLGGKVLHLASFRGVLTRINH